MKKILKHKVLPLFIMLFIVALIASAVWFIIYRVKTSVQEVADTSNLSSTDPDIKLTDMVTGLNNPMAVIFPTQNNFVYGLRNGEVRVRIPATNEDWKLLNPSGIKTIDGFGLFSMLSDKEFADNRYIYVCYSTASDLRLTRYKVSPDMRSVTETKDILTGIETKQSKTISCALATDALGTLWVGTGDSEIASAPQNPKSLAGKILRIDRNGAGVGGNQKAPFDDRIFSYGHKKITSIVLIGKLLDNAAYGYSIDQGTTKSEINYLKPGNFGYDPAGGSYNQSALMTDKAKYSSAEDAVWSSDLGLQSAVLIKSTKWQAWQNKLLITVSAVNESKVIELDENGAFKSDKTVLKDKYGRISNIFESPDGTLFGTTDNGNPDKVIQLKVVCTVCG